MSKSSTTQIEPGNFKNGTKRILLGLVLGAVLTFHYDAAAARLQADVLHYTLKKTAMTNSAVDPNARGTISGNVNSRGSVQSQILKISLNNLDANTTYTLAVIVDDSTDLTTVTNVTTGNDGSFSVNYWKKSRGTSRGQPLPSSLDSVSNIREFYVLNGSAAIVLGVMVVDPDKISYLARRNMVNTGFIPAATGLLQINGSHRRTHFHLHATKLTALTNYLLAINGSVVATNTADRKGKLNLNRLPAGSPDFIEINTVAVTDLLGNVILVSAELGIPSGFVTGSPGSLVLGAARNFSVLAGSTVTSTGNTTVEADLGVWAGTAVVGFAGIVPGGPGTVGGSIHSGDGAAQIAQGDLTTAYNDAAGRTLAPVDVANADLGGRTLTPGLYKSSGTLFITGNLTLDARGNRNGVFIFQIASELGTAGGAQVILSGRAKAANVFWQVGSSATLATTTDFKGTIMANQSIALQNGATLEGRALARIGAVTMEANAITIPDP